MNKKITLDEIGRELPFSVPENYFHDFAERIDRMTGTEPVHTPVVSVRRRQLRPWMYAVAAVFSGIVVLTPILYTARNNRSMAQNKENYESYVLSQVDETVMMDCYLNNNNGSSK